MLEYRAAQAKSPRWLWFFVGVILVVSLFTTSLLVWQLTGRVNMAYHITSDAVVIHYATADIEIPRDSITVTRLAETLTGGIRVNGTAMPGLYQGHWRFRETGNITLYASVTSPVVILETANGKWGITPADAPGFLQALSAGQPGTWPPAEGKSPWTLGIPLVALTVGGLGLAVWLLIYYARLPLLLRYTLADDALHIDGGRVHLRLPYAEISNATYATLKGIPMRLIGAQVPGLYWGRFRWKAAGPNLRIYATQYKPIVLVTHGNETYGISPEDGEGFVAELKKRIGRISE